MPVWHFTRAVHQYTERQRELLAEFLQAMANLDGAANTKEVYAVRRINSLLRVDQTVEAAA
jgi:uncharacterized tellurite resistance protein B-like protein